MWGKIFGKQLEMETGLEGIPLSVLEPSRRVAGQRGHSSRGRVSMSQEGSQRWPHLPSHMANQLRVWIVPVAVCP